MKYYLELTQVDEDNEQDTIVHCQVSEEMVDELQRQYYDGSLELNDEEEE